MRARVVEWVGPFSDAAELERRPERHGSVSSLTAIDGSVVAATHEGFLAAAAREVIARYGLRGEPICSAPPDECPAGGPHEYGRWDPYLDGPTTVNAPAGLRCVECGARPPKADDA